MVPNGFLLSCISLLPLFTSLKCPCDDRDDQNSCRIKGSVQLIPKNPRIVEELYFAEDELLAEQTIAASFRLRISGLNVSDYGFVYNETSLKIDWIPQRNDLFLPAVLRPKLFASKPNMSGDVVILTLKFADRLYAERTQYRLTIFNAFNSACQQTAVFEPPPTAVVNLDCAKLKFSRCRSQSTEARRARCGTSANVSTVLLKKHGNWDAEVDVTIPQDVVKSSPTVSIYYGRCNGPIGPKSRDFCVFDMDTVGVIRLCGNASDKCLNSFLFQLPNVGFKPYAVQVCVGDGISDFYNRTIIGRRLKLPITEDEDNGFSGWKTFVGYGILITILFILLAYSVVQKHRQKKLSAGIGREYCELDESDVQIDFNREIGSGTFTSVFKGALTKESRAIADGPVVLDGQCRIAIKIMHNNVSERERKLFNAEIERNKLLARSNERIVNFIGLLAMGTTPAIVVEFCAKGCLLEFLIEHRLKLCKKGSDAMNVDLDEIPNVRRDYILNVQKLIRFAFQICVGLEYLASQKMLHRDLMAKHVLVTADDSAKIGQFRHATSAMNQSKSLERTDVNALRWMSPEVLRAQAFSPSSDIWSLGIVIFEILTVGGFPYPDIANCDLMDRLDQGHRLERPTNATNELYSIMRDCWKTDPSDRPNCQTIRERLACAFDAIEGNHEANRLRIDPNLACYSHSEVSMPRRLSQTDSARSSMRRGETRPSIRSAVNESERLLGFVE